MNEPLKAVETSEGLLRSQGAKVWSYPADLSKPDAPRWLFENAIADLNGLDLLVNNAGVNIPGRSRTSPKTTSTTSSDWISAPMSC